MAIRRTTLSPAFQSLSETALFFGQLVTLGWESLGFIVRGRINVQATLRQMAEVGVGALSGAVITVGFSGAVFTLYLAAQLVAYGQAGSTGLLVGKSLALELAPVVTGVVVSARSGSAIAAELGSMKVTEQVDALKTMGVSPVEYLVVPRVVGIMLMMPIVAAIANLAGLYGASLTAAMGGVSHTLFWRSYQGTLISDEVTGLLKTLPFGALIALIGCRQGLQTEGGAQDVGRATTSAVVFGSISIYVLDFFISLVIQDLSKLS